MNLKKYNQLCQPDNTSEPEVPLHLLTKPTLQKMNYDFTKQIHVISQPYTIKDSKSKTDYNGKVLIRESPGKDQSELDFGVETPKNQKMMVVPGTDITALNKYKDHFGKPNFYKLFRSFYKMCQIPKEAQNNPLGIYMDKNSVVRGFKEVFDIDNEEIAIRFYKVFTVSKAELMHLTVPKTIEQQGNAWASTASCSDIDIGHKKGQPQFHRIYNINLLRFMEVMMEFLDTVSNLACNGF